MASRGLVFALALMALAVIPPVPAHAADDARALWERYRAEFVSADGRVMDRSRADITTSESQAYGMILALSFDDRTTFDLLWGWTQRNLGVRPDGLLAWLWGRRPTGAWEAMEFNNATDADVLAAYALLLASERWGAGEYRASALKLVHAMREKLAVEVAGSVYLLPGYHGFAGDTPGSVVLNPSYMVFSAYRAFARLDDRDFWERVHRDSLSLVQRACFSPFCLPADWVQVAPDGHLSLHAGHAPRYGYEAVRTFMHLAWARSPMPDGLARLLTRHGQTGAMPGWIDLSTGEVSAEPAPAGFTAIYARAARSAGHGDAAAALEREASAALEREMSRGASYYSFSLYLLARFEAAP